MRVDHHYRDKHPQVKDIKKYQKKCAKSKLVLSTQEIQETFPLSSQSQDFLTEFSNFASKNQIVVYDVKKEKQASKFQFIETVSMEKDVNYCVRNFFKLGKPNEITNKL